MASTGTGNFYIFVGDMDSGTGSMKLCGADRLEGRDAIRTDLDRLE